jgi:hypothetical protein
MGVTRGEVLRRLAAETDAERESTIPISTLAAACGVDEAAVRSPLDGLVDCDLARVSPDGRARVTITGEELLGLDAAGPVIVDPDGTAFIGGRAQSEDDMEGDRR